MEKGMEQVKKAVDEVKDASNGLLGSILFAGILTYVTYMIYKKIGEFPIGRMVTLLLGIISFVIWVVAISCFIDLKRAKKHEKMEEENHREELEFGNIDPNNKELRAERLYRLNQKQLMRYYDMNLNQTKFLSSLGIILIIFGVVIISGSLILYVFYETDNIFLMIGSVSGILIDFVGALFIKMYNKNVEAAVVFHAKFAESNNLLLANSIAHKIEDDTLREQTLSDVSKKIVR